MKRTRIKPQSKKRRAENAERRTVMRAAFGEHPACQLGPALRAHGVDAGCWGHATEVDERLRRSAGGSITDPAGARPVCAPCHRWLTTHPLEARTWGLEDRPHNRYQQET